MLNQIEKRFWSKVDKQEFCWIWTACKDKKGYGSFLLGSSQKAHRISYELVKGKIPEGMILYHLCKNKSCVNPSHLEAVSSRINSLRAKNTIAYIHSDKDKCPKGHPYLGYNLIISNNGYNGARRCRKCKNEQERARDRAKRPQTRKYRI